MARDVIGCLGAWAGAERQEITKSRRRRGISAGGGGGIAHEAQTKRGSPEGASRNRSAGPSNDGSERFEMNRRVSPNSPVSGTVAGRARSRDCHSAKSCQQRGKASGPPGNKCIVGRALIRPSRRKAGCLWTRPRESSEGVLDAGW